MCIWLREAICLTNVIFRAFSWALFSKQLDLFLEWSAPSAIGIAGLGGGFEAGAEVTNRAVR